jgi:hypothetical protein
MELVRKFLTPDEIGSPAIRWNEDCDCAQQSPDGGTTWVDVPQADPRSAAGYALPPAPTDNPQCDGAARMIAALHRLIDAVVSSAGTVAAVSTVLSILSDFLFGIGTLIALVLEVVSGLLALGQDVLDVAFTQEVYDQLLCIALNRIGTDGHFTDTAWTDFQSDVLGAFGGTVSIAMSLIFQLEGINGFNNASSVGTETGDCLACSAWCEYIDFTETDGGYAPIVSQGHSLGSYSPGEGFVSGVSAEGNSSIAIRRDANSATYTKVTFYYDDAGTPGAIGFNAFQFIGDIQAGTDIVQEMDGSTTTAVPRLDLYWIGGGGGGVTLKAAKFEGVGEAPGLGGACP